MKVFNILKIASTSMRTNKLRAALTILGIVIGIAAIMTVVSVGKSAEKVILGEIGNMGAEIVVVRPGRHPKGPSDVATMLLVNSLKVKDFEALKNKSNVPYATEIAPSVIVPGSVSYGGETTSPTVFGWSADMMAHMFDIYPEEGEFFTENDIKQKSSVAIIGSKVKKELFGDSDAVGQNITIKNKNFRVIGTIGSRGQTSFFNVDDMVLLPYSTAQSYLLGVDYYHEIIIQAQSADLVAATVLNVEQTLRESHNITDPDKDDFYIETQAGMVDQIKTIIGTLTLFLSAVVAISLVVGGIGIMNIMFVSVTERTREIGLRKALGATKNDILFQFLVEAVMLTGLGGIIGIFFGSIFAWLAALGIGKSLGTDVGFSFPLDATILGLVVSTLVGLVFGIYPARKAANKDAIEALRYE